MGTALSILLHTAVLIFFLNTKVFSKEESKKVITLNISRIKIEKVVEKKEAKANKRKGKTKASKSVKKVKKVKKYVEKKKVKKRVVKKIRVKKVRKKIKITKRETPKPKFFKSISKNMKKEKKEIIENVLKKEVEEHENYESEPKKEIKGQEVEEVKTGGEGKSLAFAKKSINYEKEFVSQNYEVIRSLIVESIKYPYIARRMGWEGEVIIEIVLSSKGCESLKILKSSGHKILDKNTLKTVKKLCGKFPKPQKKVIVKIPVVYRLNS